MIDCGVHWLHESPGKKLDIPARIGEKDISIVHPGNEDFLEMIHGEEINRRGSRVGRYGPEIVEQGLRADILGRRVIFSQQDFFDAVPVAFDNVEVLSGVETDASAL